MGVAQRRRMSLSMKMLELCTYLRDTEEIMSPFDNGIDILLYATIKLPIM
jgi:hypothetical protein